MFLRRVVGIEVTRSFDVTEDGIEGKLINRNPDDHDWLAKIERERKERDQLSLITSKKKIFGRKMASLSLTTDDDGIYDEVTNDGITVEGGKIGADNMGFEADAGVSSPTASASVEIPSLPSASVEIPSLPSASVDGKLEGEAVGDVRGETTDINENFYANLSVDGPGALDPAVKAEGSLDPGVAHSNGEADEDEGEDFPSENFWAGCRSMDLQDWVESVKTQPPDKIKPSVVNSSLPANHRLHTESAYVDIVDPVIKDGVVHVQPPAGTFSYIKTGDPVDSDKRVPSQGEPAVGCGECLSDPRKYCCSNVDKGRLDTWYWIALVVFLVAVIIVLAIVVGVRGTSNEADSNR